MTRLGLMTLVCGGRVFRDAEAVNNLLDRVAATENIGCILQGGARGADRLAALWAFSRRVPMLECPAQWDTMGRPAGSIRNQWMLDWGRPDLVIAFAGGDGTADMVRRARAAGVRVLLG